MVLHSICRNPQVCGQTQFIRKRKEETSSNPCQRPQVPYHLIFQFYCINQVFFCHTFQGNATRLGFTSVWLQLNPWSTGTGCSTSYTSLTLLCHCSGCLIQHSPFNAHSFELCRSMKPPRFCTDCIFTLTQKAVSFNHSF